MTLAEIEARLLDERQVKTSDSSIARFFQRHNLSDKKRCTPASSIAKTWRKRATAGKRCSRRLIRTGLYSLMKPVQTRK
ncbi:transposase [Rhodoblastus sphagnicola]|uniref:hypothetical protein n=1 Tax=Rhodoblastus sphagnicola TaxID=333368 RepID=UPI001304D08A|nr:hypothetical protein [Rhodoblastus sphagnicola]MBB4200075.1 transposase [Rhodoblastus sphagnicola]